MVPILREARSLENGKTCKQMVDNVKDSNVDTTLDFRMNSCCNLNVIFFIFIEYLAVSPKPKSTLFIC